MTGTACGPHWMPQPVNNLLFGWFFEASCIKHDDGYRKGGSEFRRWYCDYKFLRAMLRDTKRTKDWTSIPKLGVAVGFYVAVAAGGWSSFNYRTNA